MGLVIFDCDGVLVDSERLFIRIDALVLSEFGWPMSEAEVVERFMGRSHEAMTAEMEVQLGHRLPDEWDTSFEHPYREAFEENLTPVDGILEALDRIPYTPHASPPAAGTKRCATEVASGKLVRDLFLHAAERMGSRPAACAVVEDSRYGVEAARAAGMRVFGYAGGVTPEQQPKGPNTTVFHDMRELPRLLATV